jgi:Effector-associated domain 1
MQSDRSILREEIVRWFDPHQLKQALREGSTPRFFDAIVSPTADFEQQVFQLVDRAEKEGWLLALLWQIRLTGR